MDRELLDDLRTRHFSPDDSEPMVIMSRAERDALFALIDAVPQEAGRDDKRDAALWRIAEPFVRKAIRAVEQWDHPTMAHPFAKLAEPVIAAMKDSNV